MSRNTHYIDGRFVEDKASDRIAVYNPATEEQIAEIPDASAQTVNVELPRDAYRSLALRAGEVAYLTPTRRSVFAS